MLILDRIRANRRKREKLTADIEALDGELADLVDDALTNRKATRQQIAEALGGVSLQRVYQIRRGRRSGAQGS